MYWTGSIVLLSLLALAGARDTPRTNVAIGCEVSLSKKTCLAVDGCYWCASTTFAGQQPLCVDEAQAVNFPPWFYKCSHKKAPGLAEEFVKPTQTGCDSPRTEDDCLANPACVWCQSNFGPAQAHCMDAEQAKFIPPSYLTCKDKKDDPPQVLQTVAKGGVTPQPGVGCTDAMDKKSCLKSSACYWCENAYSPGVGARCMDKTEAQFLPPGFFKCRKGKDPKPDPKPEPAPTPGPEAEDVVVNADPKPAPTCTDAKDRKACKHIAGCDWCENKFIPKNGSLCLDATAADFIPASVFKCTGSKKKTPYLSSGAKPAPVADPCMDAVDSKACKIIDGCAWCENKFNPDIGSKCMKTSAAQFMPPTVFKCKAAKKKTAALSASAVVEVTPAADPCTTAMDKPSCKDLAGCAWCESTFNPTFGSRCMDAAKAQFIPATVFKCKAAKKATLAVDPEPEPTPTPAPTNPCKEPVDADSCQAVDGCAWCENVLSATGKGKCMKASKAQFLPPAVFKCTTAPTTAAVLKAAAPTRAPGADPCKSAMDKKTCKGTDGCAWCENKFNPAVGSLCMDASQSAFIPASVYKCKAAKKGVEAVEAGPVDPTPGPAPGVACGTSLNKKGCLGSPGCYWCTESFGPAFGPVTGHCYNEMEAKFLPAYMYKCKAAKQQEVFDAAESDAESADDATAVSQAVKDLFAVLKKTASDDGATPYTPPTPPTPGGAGTGCTGAMSKDACFDQKDCYWCTDKFSPGGDARCMDATTAKFLPDIVFKCKKGKHKKDTPAVLRTASDDGATSYTPPTPSTPGGAGAGCTGAMTKDACFDQKDCYWCTDKFSPGGDARCMDATTAKFLPDIVFKCKKGKHKKDTPTSKAVSY